MSKFVFLTVHVINSDWSVLRGKAVKKGAYLPPVTKKYERRTKAKTTMADGAFTHPGFFNFRFGTSKTWKGIAYKASILEKRVKGRYFEEYDWSSCSINCPIKIVYRSWQSKAAKTWGWLKCCNLIGSPTKRRYFQIPKTRVTFTLPSAWEHFILTRFVFLFVR